MTTRTKIFRGAALAGVVALGVTAPASAASVERHLERADAAVEKATGFAEDGRDSAALAHLRRADRETRAADRHTRSGDAEERALDGRRVAKQFQENAETAATVVAGVDGKDDARAAAEVEDGIDGRRRALDRLTALAERLPEAAQKGLAKSIEQVTKAGTRPATTLDDAMQDGEVDTDATDEVEEAIAAVGDGAGKDASRIDELIEIVPEAAHKGLERARERAQAGKDRAAARSNGAKTCKAERTADPAAFEAKYRTNAAEPGEESNAFGMCVSGHSAANPPGSKGISNRPDTAGPPADKPTRGRA